MSFAALEQEREAQSAFAAEVLQQIQSFGEAANDEFDVQWATSATKEALPDHREVGSIQGICNVQALDSFHHDFSSRKHISFCRRQH